jgi:hypothetical protein
VDEIQVDLVDAEPSQAPLGGGHRIAAPPLIELAPGIDLVVRNTSRRGTPLSRSARPTLSSLP